MALHSPRKALPVTPPIEHGESQRMLREPFRVEPHAFGFRSELNLDKALELADELESLELLRKFNP